MRATRRLDTRLKLIVAVGILSIYPALVSLSEGGFDRIFNYFVADTFYYLTVAKHAANHLVPTFDGVYPTNGFHPLWQALLNVLSSLGGLTSKELIGYTFFLCLSTTVVGLILFSLGVLQATRSFWIALFATVPGYFYWMFSSLDPAHFSSWANANGMESGLSSLFFGALVYWVTRPRSLPWTSGQVLVATVLITGVFLSRLDDVFYVPPFILFVGCVSHRASRRRHIAISVGVPTLALVAYVLTNRLYANQFLPISGSMKSGGIVALLRNLGDPLAALFPSFGNLLYGQLSSESWGRMAAKVLALILPGIGALGFLWHMRRTRVPVFGLKGSNYIEAALMFVAMGALLKSVYNFTRVGLWHQGTWYFTTNLMTLHILIAYVSSSWFPLPKPVDAIISGKARALVGSLAFAILWIQAGAFGKTHANPGYHEHYAGFWHQRAMAETELTRFVGGAGVLSYDDGIIAFSLDRSVMSGLGFSLDREAAEAKRRGELLRMAYARGIRVMGSINYFPELSPDFSSDEVRQLLRSASVTKWERLDEWNFKVLDLDGVEHGHFVAFFPRQGPLTSSVDGQVAEQGTSGFGVLWGKLRRRFGF